MLIVITCLTLKLYINYLLCVSPNVLQTSEGRKGHFPPGIQCQVPGGVHDVQVIVVKDWMNK